MEPVRSPVAFRELEVAEFQGLLQRLPHGLFAILDSCDAPVVPAKVRELGAQRAESLFQGEVERDYWAIAPYLVQLDEALFAWIGERLGNAPWGILVAAPTDLASLKRHFRKFLLVQDPQGKTLYFRFYDPRVLPTFLASCTRDQAIQFFGPVEWFAVSQRQQEARSICRIALAGGDDS